MKLWGRCILLLTFTACVQEGAQSTPERYRTILRNCMQPRPTSVCKPLLNAWYFRAGACRKVDPTLCGGGKNLFATLQECNMECKSGKKGNRQRCMKPPLFGSCSPLLQTWRFDTMTGHCKMLNYTICGLGITETATEEACITACKDETS
uniref:Pancreatic trypsin inhibitor n=1 Tax=Rhipicephalus appendiculatus TaxID=34631 RepID=A0A131YFZ4_RHIAP